MTGEVEVLFHPRARQVGGSLYLPGRVCPGFNGIRADHRCRARLE
jgi:hypothetical protein